LFLEKGNDLSQLTLPSGLAPVIYLLSVKNARGKFFEKIILTE